MLASEIGLDIVWVCPGCGHLLENWSYADLAVGGVPICTYNNCGTDMKIQPVEIVRTITSDAVDFLGVHENPMDVQVTE